MGWRIAANAVNECYYHRGQNSYGNCQDQHAQSSPGLGHYSRARAAVAALATELADPRPVGLSPVHLTESEIAIRRR